MPDSDGFTRNSEGKIVLPEHMTQPSAEQQARREAVENAKKALEAEQKRAVYEKPFEQFKYRMPVDYYQHFEPSEMKEINQAEEIAFNTHRGPAIERANAQRAWIAAGGTEESFRRNYSEDDAVAARAAKIMERGADSPY